MDAPAHRLGLVLAAALALVPLGAARPSATPLRACTLAGGVQARCGRFRVPENRGIANGRTIPLRLAVVPARDGRSRPDALLYLAGGPGGSAIAGAVGVRQLFSATNETRDIVLVDQRGTGSSNRSTARCRRGRSGPTRRRSAPTSGHVSRGSTRTSGSTRPCPRWRTSPRSCARSATSRSMSTASPTARPQRGLFLAQHPDLVRTAILDGGTLLTSRSSSSGRETGSGRSARSSRAARRRPAAAEPTRASAARRSS